MAHIESIEVGGSPMEVLCETPAGDGPHPGLVIAPHGLASDGFQNDRFTPKLIARYAENGYATAVPFIFHRRPIEEDRPTKVQNFKDDEIAADMTAARNLLCESLDIDATRIGVIGHCLGGRAAWLCAATNPAYKSLAIFYGGGIRKPWGHDGPAPIDLAAKIACPIIGFFGNDDTNPSPDDVDYAAALEAAGKKFSFHRYDGTGHAFQDENAPDDRYREAASEDAWQKVLAHFGETLMGVR